jgi:hypothetical protein
VKSAITSNVSGSACTSAVLVQRSPMESAAVRVVLLYHYSLHSVQDNRVFAHAEVIVRTPYVDLVLGVGRVSDRELCRHPVDVVEVSVGLVLMFLLQLCLVEALVVESARCCLPGAALDETSSKMLLRIGFSLRDGCGLGSSLCMRAFASRNPAGRERDILCLKFTSARSNWADYFRLSYSRRLSTPRLGANTQTWPEQHDVESGTAALTL